MIFLLNYIMQAIYMKYNCKKLQIVSNDILLGAWYNDVMTIKTWQARSEKNITLKQLEKLSGISKTTLNDIENGKLSPTLYQLECIAKALDVKITDLFESEYK